MTLPEGKPGDRAPENGSRPTTGGRVELRRRDPAADLESIPDSGGSLQAAYEARWTTPQGTFIGELFVSNDGRITLQLDGEAPPAWLSDFTSQLLRATARSVIGPPPGTWPRRITRWRAAPEER